MFDRRQFLQSLGAGVALGALDSADAFAAGKRRRLILGHKLGNPYGAVAGNTAIPYTFSNSANPIQHTKSIHRVVVAATGLRFTFSNFVLNNQGELINNVSVNGYYHFFLRVGIKYNGVFYPLTFGGSRDVYVPFGTYVTSDPLPISVAAGTSLTCYTRRTAERLSDTNYNILASHSSVTGSGEGVQGTTNTALDFTTGGIPGGDTAVVNLSNAAGVLTATIGSDHGSGYTGTTVVGVYDPATWGTNAFNKVTNGVSATGQPVLTLTSTTSLVVGMPCGGRSGIAPGSVIQSISAGVSVTLDRNLIAQVSAGNTVGFVTAGYGGGAGFAATATQTAGVLNGTVSTTGSGFNYTTRTIASLSGGGSFGANQLTYGPCAITGIPNVKGVTLQLIGNSITRGVGANDGLGDEFRNFGLIERAFRSRYPTINNSYSGNTIVAIKGNNYATTYAMVKSVCNPTHVFICNPTNDFAAGTPITLAAAKNNMAQIIARERALGKKVITETHYPRTTSSDGFTTTANQTPINASFTAGGDVDSYDTWLTSGASGVDYVIDVRPFCRDNTLTDRWRADLGAFTGDGIHPQQVDIFALLMQSIIPNLS